MSVYQGSLAFATDAVKHAMDKVLKALGDVIDQILALQPDFPVKDIPLLKVVLERRGSASGGPSSLILLCMCRK